MTRLRIRDRAWEVDDFQWERLVRAGRVPPEALVLSQRWTRGVWRRADTLEVYHLFRPSRPPEGSALSGRSAGTAMPGGFEPWSAPGTGVLPGTRVETPRHSSGLPRAFAGRGLSVTEALILVNVLVSAALVLAWGAEYSDRLWPFSERLHRLLFAGWAPVLLIPLFLHASARHLLGNMIGLAAGGAAVEEFYGPLRTAGMYLFAGVSGAAFSLLRAKPVLSVGASGAIMGLYGVVLVFLVRYRGRFSERQKYKTIRVYLPLLVLALFPSLFMADFYSHLGGFLGGIVIALLVPPDPRRVPWSRRPSDGGPRNPAPEARKTERSDARS